MEQQNKFLGHITRHPEEQTSKVTFGEDLGKLEQGYKRVGKPRENWFDINYKYAWEKHCQTNSFDIYDENSQDQSIQIIAKAHENTF